MNSRKHAAATLLAIGVLAWGQVPAHHSTAMYDADNRKTLEGVVKDFFWVNPHTLLSVIVPAGAGQSEQVWTIESTSPGRLTRSGWNKTTFKRGDKVRIEIRPLRDGKPGGYFYKAILIDQNVEVSPNGVGPVGTVAPPPDGPIPTS